MRLNFLPWAFVLSGLAFAQDISLKAVKKAFDDAHIPADLNIAFNPSVLLEVTFPEMSGPSITLYTGLQLPRNQTAGPPFFSVIGAASKGPFVVAAVDPDAPTPEDPTNAQVRHFLGGNFTPVKLRGIPTPLLHNSTPAVSHFQQPTPHGGIHRYIFLIFEQSSGFNSQTLVNSTTPLQLFNISEFADAVGLGAPIGGTYMLVAFDPTSE